MTRPTHLRVEHLEEPLGIDVRLPRLSWQLPVGAREQVAYHVRAGEWDSGRVDSAQSILVPYAGPALLTGQRVSWRVKVWTDAGETEWSEQAWWEMGLLNPEDWFAQWIEPVEADELRSRTTHPAYLLRGLFNLPVPPSRARLYVTAHGIYEFFINGQRVGDRELTPGLTSYWTNLQVQTFDVTELLMSGENVVGAVISDGWFRGQIGGLHTHVFGDSVALLAQLHVDGIDGSSMRFGTGPDWLTATGSIVAADLRQGQIVDLRQDHNGWSTTEAALDGWLPVTVQSYNLQRLCSSPAPSVRRVQELKPVAITRAHPDRQVIDLGQNINGWIRLTNLGPAGTTLTITHGETLDAHGDVTLDNVTGMEDELGFSELQVDMSNLKLPLQVDRVTSAGKPDECFEPRHTTHGFRYVRIEGHPNKLRSNDVAGVVVHTDLRRTGWFECSNERINRLHEAAVWSFRGNACDIPTDCPTRERSGWTGDWQVFVPTAAFLYDVAGFATKWLRDLAAEQEPGGAVHHIVPNPNPPYERMKLDVLRPGSAGWGDAAVMVPWEIYRAYGDKRLLEEQWPSMAAWVEYAARAARENRHPSRVAARPSPAPHEVFIWDSGFHWGEWLEPGDFDFNPVTHAVVDQGDVATAYLHYSSRLLAQIALVLGRDSDAARYRDLAVATKTAWQTEFIRPDATLSRETQATYVRALAFDLVPDDLRSKMAERLVDLINKADTHLGTGFLATPYLLPVLAETGHLDVAYQLLFQDTEPSWLAMIDRGATTIWETWNAIDESGNLRGPRGAHSLNHYSKGAVISFLHRYVAGIQLLDEPAYRRFRVAPMPGGGITSARAAHDSPYGRIETTWRIEGDEFMLHVTIPAGTSAEIWMPDGQRFEAQPGNENYKGLARSVSPKRSGRSGVS